MTDVERMLKIASRMQGTFRTRDLTMQVRKNMKPFTNMAVTVNIATARGFLRQVRSRNTTARLFALTAKGRKIAADL